MNYVLHSQLPVGVRVLVCSWNRSQEKRLNVRDFIARLCRLHTVCIHTEISTVRVLVPCT